MEEKEQKIPLVKDAEAISKLTKAPVPVTIGTYELSEDMQELAKTGEVPAFLHPLTWLERNHIRASSTMAYRFWMGQRGDKDQAKEAVSAIIPRMTVYFALKNDSKADSKRFFDSQDALMAYPFEQAIFELYERYLKEYSLSETEWGNWLRARSLGTWSALPAISPAPTSLGETSHN